MPPELAAWLLLLVGTAASILVAVALRPPKVNPAILAAAFFSSWLTNELVLHQLLGQLCLAAALLAFGALSTWPGALGLALVATASVGLLAIWRQARTAGPTITDALHDALDPPVAKAVHERAPHVLEVIVPGQPAEPEHAGQKEDVVWFAHGPHANPGTNERQAGGAGRPVSGALRDHGVLTWASLRAGRGVPNGMLDRSSVGGKLPRAAQPRSRAPGRPARRL